MRTNIMLDDDLVDAAFRLSKAKTKRELIALALKEFVETHKRRNLLDLVGKVEFAKDYDYKKLREKR